MEYRQVRVISGKGPGPHQFAAALRGIAVDRSDQLYAVGDCDVKVFDPTGTLRRRWRTGKPGYCVAVATNGTVYVGQEGRMEIYDKAGRLSDTWQDPRRFGLVTAIGLTADHVFIADARDRCIRRYDRHGEFLNNIGKDNRMKGFLVPNGVLDLAVDSRGIIHATNPGKHRVERYTPTGELLGHFGRFDGLDPEGFTGCCNPTNVTVTGRGHVIVTEKAGPRAKVYNAKGKLLAIIGAGAFDLSCKNMDVAVDSQGRVYVVDTVRLQICVFAPSQSEATSRPASAEAGEGVEP